MSDTLRDTKQAQAALKMEGVAVNMLLPMVLYTGTSDQRLYTALTTFAGDQRAFETAFMQHNKRQSQTAQMGAGIYATPHRIQALGYGTNLIQILIPMGTPFLNLADTAVTGLLRKAGVKPSEWAGANPRVLVRFNGDYHLVKTCVARYAPG